MRSNIASRQSIGSISTVGQEAKLLENGLEVIEERNEEGLESQPDELRLGNAKPPFGWVKQLFTG